jgi:5-(carboxyamino)imidazole ribonucleotide synthase
MFTIAARRLGYRVHVFSPDDDTPTGQVADVEIKASYDDLEAVAKFARGVSVVTFEFENVPSATTGVIDRYCPVRPGGNVLHTTQHRFREKSFFASHGLPVTPFRRVTSLPELEEAVTELGIPAVLKTAAWGYDGKGQTIIKSSADAARAWAELKTEEAILEAFIDYECEVSVIVARGPSGETATYGPFRNQHSNHILDVTTFPAGLPTPVEQAALEVAREATLALDVVGILCIEFFVTRGGEVMINEVAPRPHNSGHLTIDGHVTCQFEQQVRAVCGLPLGSNRSHGPCAMANLLGDVWFAEGLGGEPRWEQALELPGVKLHLYGKQEARLGRKMGHLTALGATAEEAEGIVRGARERLVGRG